MLDLHENGYNEISSKSPQPHRPIADISSFPTSSASKTPYTRDAKKVVQLTLDNKFIRVYPSLTSAEKDNNISPSHVGKACRGIYSQAKGYKWIYLDEYEKTHKIPDSRS